MTDIEVVDVNCSFIKLIAEPHIIMELAEEFTFYAPGYQHSPKFKKRLWDGRIRLVNRSTRLVYAGLKQRIDQWAKEHGYTTNINWSCNAMNPVSIQEWFDRKDALNLPFLAKDYQHEILYTCVHANHGTVISPTGSGKSFIMYLLMRWYDVHCYPLNVLIVVPTVNLVEQMYKDFSSYGFDVEKNCLRVHEKGDRIDADSDPLMRLAKFITISTSDSLQDLDPEYFEKFDMVIVDEAHGAKAKTIVKIVTQCTKARYRFGFTGTLNDTKVHQLVLEGLFGPIIQGRTTRELIDEKHLAEVKIKCIVLEYPPEIRKELKGATYDQELNFLVSNQARQRFICNLAAILEGSTFVLFRLVDKHGRNLYEILRERKQENCHFVAGETEVDEREITRLLANENNQLTVVASQGVFSGGVNVPNLHNIIFASPSKAKIQVLQSIGRSLRRTELKQDAVIYDFVDNLSTSTHKNYSMRHFEERIRLYNQELFPYTINRVPLKGPFECQQQKQQELKSQEHI